MSRIGRSTGQGRIRFQPTSVWLRGYQFSSKFRGHLMLPRLALFAALIFLLPSAVRAQNDLASAIVGVWKVVSIETKEVETGKVTYPLGDQLTGTFVFTPGGRFSGMVFNATRKAPATANATEAERLTL